MGCKAQRSRYDLIESCVFVGGTECVISTTKEEFCECSRASNPFRIWGEEAIQDTSYLVPSRWVILREGEQQDEDENEQDQAAASCESLLPF